MLTGQWFLTGSLLLQPKAIVMAVLLALLAGCAAPAAAPSEPAAAPAAGEPVRIVFWTAQLSDEEVGAVRTQLDTFTAQTGIEVVAQNLTTEFSGAFLTAVAAGTPPDLVGAWLWQFESLQPSQVFVRVTDLNPKLDLGVFTPDAQAASVFDGDVYALPWARDLCFASFRLLGIPQGSRMQPEAYALIEFLTAADRQKDNYMNPPVWYPTLVEVNDSADGPGCVDTGTAIHWPNSEQQKQVRSTVEDSLRELEQSLKGSVYWPDDQPTELNFERATGIGNVEGEGGGQEKFTEVLLGAAPVKASDPKFFLEENLLAYFESTGAKHLTIGAIQVLDPEVFGGLVEQGTYAVVWQFETGNVADDKLILVDQQGNEVYKEGKFYPLFGANAPAPDPAMQITEPFAAPQHGSWELCIYLDSRGGCIP